MKLNFDILLTLLLFSMVSFSGVRPVSFLMAAIIFSFCLARNNVKISALLRLTIVLMIIAFLGLYGTMQNLTINFTARPMHLGYLRPILLAMQLSMEVIFCAIMLFKLNREKCMVTASERADIEPNMKIFDTVLLLMLCEYIIASYWGIKPFTAWQDVYTGEIRFSGLTPEPGIVAFPVIIRAMIMPATSLNFFALFCGALSFVLSESSLIFLYLILVATKLNVKYLKSLFVILTFLAVLFNHIVTDLFIAILIKIQMLLQPTIEMGGRYAANLISSKEIFISMLQPHGLSSYDRIQHSFLLSPSFHHGGSDLLNIMLDFGYLVLMLLIVVPSRFMLSRRQIFYITIIILPLMIKGQGIYSAGVITSIIIAIAILGTRKYEKDTYC